ncbi:MAG TPA: serine hydrolase domain-containing protein [Armatimonadota bacterium]
MTPPYTQEAPSPQGPGFGTVSGLLHRGVEEGVFPGAVCLVLHRGRPVFQEAVGRHGGPDSPAVEPDAIYDLASLTKPLVTAMCLLASLDRGEVCLSDTLDASLSDEERRIASPALRRVPLEALLTHTSGLPAWIPLAGQAQDASGARTQVLATPLQNPTRGVYTYSDLGYILLGLVLERCQACSLDALFRARVTEPLGLASTGFWRSADGGHQWSGAAHAQAVDLRRLVAPTAFCPRRGRLLTAEVHDSNADVLGGVAGHAGLFSTAREVGALAELVRQGGSLGGVRVLSPAASALARASRLDPSLGGHTAGWFCRPNGYHVGGDLASPASFSHSGFTGTSVLVDPERELTVVLLTNAVQCEGKRHLRFRRVLHNAAVAAVTDLPWRLASRG